MGRGALAGADVLAVEPEAAAGRDCIGIPGEGGDAQQDAVDAVVHAADVDVHLRAGGLVVLVLDRHDVVPPAAAAGIGRDAGQGAIVVVAQALHLEIDVVGRVVGVELVELVVDVGFGQADGHAAVLVADDVEDDFHGHRVVGRAVAGGGVVADALGGAAGLVRVPVQFGGADVPVLLGPADGSDRFAALVGADVGQRIGADGHQDEAQGDEHTRRATARWRPPGVWWIGGAIGVWAKHTVDRALGETQLARRPHKRLRL